MYTRFCACKTVLGARLWTWEIVPVKEQTCTLLIITLYDSRKYTLHKLVLKPCLFQSYVLLLSSRLSYYSLHDDYSPFLYTTWSIYIAGLPFLIIRNGKQCSKSNILTTNHDHVLENSSSAVVNKLPNTIMYWKVVKCFNIRLR